LVREVDADDHKYQIIAGERRWRASKGAEIKEIPARILKTNEVELLEIGLIENIQREDLNPMEEAEGYQSLISRFGKTQESLAEAVGKSRVHVTNMLRLLQLPDAVRDHLRAGEITTGHARAALGSDNPEGIISDVIARKLSVRETEKLVQKEKNRYNRGGEKAVSGLADEKDVDTEALEADLSRALGLEVDIRSNAKGGELRIKYRHLEQLDEICRRLSRSA
jgi:ParB family chromosome partitioning protein